MTKPVLVTSAAGGAQGKTGRHVSEMLLRRGVRVRAFVHRIDERSDRLKSLGAEDVSRIAVGLLTGPDRAAGTAYPVIGSANSIGEIVGAFARVFNRDVHYQEITDDQWRSEDLARGWNAHAIEHLSSLWKSLRAAGLSAEAGRFAVTDTIEKIGGAKPKTFEQFVREQKSELAAPPVAARATA